MERIYIRYKEKMKRIISSNLWETLKKSNEYSDEALDELTKLFIESLIINDYKDGQKIVNYEIIIDSFIKWLKVKM